MKSLTSIIVPTYKEAENIQPLTEKINAALKKEKIEYEIIIVDDNSQDGIEKVVKSLERKYPVSLVVRTNERGLSSAVIEGLKRSRGDILVVMDADLSHPPEKIPELIKEITNNNADFVVGSRFVEGGSALHFDWYRKMNAWISKMLARPFTKVKDPMAGFFAFPRTIMCDLGILNPLGFKIGLELIVKCNPRKTVEVPIQFQERLHGESKLSLREQFLYLFHLRRLFMYKYKKLAEFLQFAVIGSIGMIVDLAFVYISYGLLSLPFRIARVVGFVFALTNNFLLNRRFTFPDSRGGNIIRQYAGFFSVCLVGFGVNWIISVYLYEHLPFFNRYYLVAAFAGILGGLVVNFFGSKFIVFKSR